MRPPPDQYWRNGLAARHRVESTTFVLLPALDLQTRVAETVRKQHRRQFAPDRWNERNAPFARAFRSTSTYRLEKVLTMRPVDAVIAELGVP